MPKERFSSQPEAPYVQVSWGRDNMLVQVSTHPFDDDEVEGKGFFTSLDRYQINQLIRTLRKARDQAYGADA